MIGNFGIGKSFSLLNFKYLSYYRFKLVNDSLFIKAKKDYKKWLQVNKPGLLSDKKSKV